MHNLHKIRAKQFYEALRAKGLTWRHNKSALLEWAEQFDDLHGRGIPCKRIQRVLDWYCEHGIGALYVPLTGTAKTFCNRFEDIEDARDRLKGQQLQYFDEVMDFHFDSEMNERGRALAKVSQIIEFIDDLAHHRVKLPRKTKIGKTKLKKPMTVYLVFNRQAADLMDWSRRRKPNAKLDLAFAKHLDKQGWFKKVNRTLKKRRRTG